MSMTFEVKETTSPPPGIYRAEFTGVEQTTHPQYGEGVVFQFRVLVGEHAGKIASRTGKPTATTGNTTGKIIAALLGGQFKPGTVSLEACVGKTYMIQVGLGQDGKKTRVDAVMPAE
jgi:hypothetical protein